jgi:hypothetical protein
MPHEFNHPQSYLCGHSNNSLIEEKSGLADEVPGKTSAAAH